METEQIRKCVVRSGNGGAVWVPREWLGEEVLVTRLQPKRTIKEQIIMVLSPYLKDIIGIYLYGSYARGEESADSDIDVLVIAREKFELRKVKNFDFTVLEKDRLQRTIEKNPIMYYSIIQEARPILNSGLLQDLRDMKINSKKFKWFIETTLDHIETNKTIMELDKLDNNNISSYSIVYSIIMRLRGLFIIRCLLNDESFSNKEFKRWLTRYISVNDYNTCYTIYTNVRDKKKVKTTISIAIIEKLNILLESETRKLAKKINGKSKKEITKGN